MQYYTYSDGDSGEYSSGRSCSLKHSAVDDVLWLEAFLLVTCFPCILFCPYPYSMRLWSLESSTIMTQMTVTMTAMQSSGY